MDWMFVSPPNPFVEVLTSVMNSFGHRAFTKVIRVKLNHNSGGLMSL